jgi:molybdopterin molybdotransferase
MPSSLRQLTESLEGYRPDALRVDIARQAIAGSITPITDTEILPVQQTLGRVLADDLVSPINVPAHDNSAMDGYALCGSDLDGSDRVLTIVGRAFAGHPYAATVQSGECVRIMTGAVIPRGCDSVIPQELTQDASDSRVTIPANSVLPGANRRLAGEDLPAGSVALQSGRLLTPADLGLIASLGIGEISVTRRLRVAFFSTGDELRSIGQPLDEGSVYDSNRYTLQAMLERAGCEAIDLGVVRDDPAALEATLRDACRQADVIITTGGVSAGDADYTTDMMARLGDVLFWKIAMRPGRPMAFGSLRCEGREALFFGLPGNPVAVMATFYFFARDAIYRRMGTTPPALPIVRAISADAIRKRPGRTEYLRGVLDIDAQGGASVRLTGAQGSGILSSMSEANGMVVLDHEAGDIAAGEWVSVIPFNGLI